MKYIIDVSNVNRGPQAPLGPQSMNEDSIISLAKHLILMIQLFVGSL